MVQCGIGDFQLGKGGLCICIATLEITGEVRITTKSASISEENVLKVVDELPGTKQKASEPFKSPNI